MPQDYLTELRSLLAGMQRELSELKNAVRRASTIYLGHGRLLIPTRCNYSVIAFADDLQIAPALIKHGAWEMALTDLAIRSIKPGMRVLEIGANIGYFSVLFSFLAGFDGRVEVFEPNPRTHEVLRSNLRLNNVTHVCRAHALAVSNRTGEATFNTFMKNQGGSSLSSLSEDMLDRWTERPIAITVPTVTLDDHFAGEAAPFDFIKIDAEGAEPLVWMGGPRFFRELVHDRTVIAMEFNPPAIEGIGQDPHAFLSTILATGFRCWNHRPDDRMQEVKDVTQLPLTENTDLLLSKMPPLLRPA